MKNIYRSAMKLANESRLPLLTARGAVAIIFVFLFSHIEEVKGQGIGPTGLDNRYWRSYLEIQNGLELKVRMDYEGASHRFRDTEKTLKEPRSDYPDWKKTTVNAQIVKMPKKYRANRKVTERFVKSVKVLKF